MGLRSLAAAVLATALILGGCDQGAKNVKTPAGELSPEVTMQKTFRAMTDGDIEIIWNLLPASYQTDLSAVVTDFGNNMDEEIWTKAAKTIRKISNLVKAKEDIITGSLIEKSPDLDKALVDAAFKNLTGFLDKVSQSQVLELAYFKEPNIPDFLDKDLGGILDSFIVLSESPGLNSAARIEGIKKTREDNRNNQVDLVENDGSKAKVKVLIGDDEPVPMDLVKVEGKWIPQDLADTWEARIQNAHDSIAKIEESEENKNGVLMMLAMIDTQLDNLMKAETQEEMSNALGPNGKRMLASLLNVGPPNMPGMAGAPRMPAGHSMMGMPGMPAGHGSMGGMPSMPAGHGSMGSMPSMPAGHGTSGAPEMPPSMPAGHGMSGMPQMPAGHGATGMPKMPPKSEAPAAETKPGGPRSLPTGIKMPPLPNMPAPGTPGGRPTKRPLPTLGGKEGMPTLPKLPPMPELPPRPPVGTRPVPPTPSTPPPNLVPPTKND